MLKHETEENITEYLNTQGVTACKRFKIKKDGNLIETNTLLLTFNTTTLPKSLKKFYRIIQVEVYIPNPLRCFNCQRFGHHENGCPKAPGSICEKFGMGDFDHHTNACKAGLGGSVGCAVRLETRRSRVQPPPRSATFFRGD